jgi:hypothetical protein
VDTDIRGVFIEEQRSKRKESFAIRWPMAVDMSVDNNDNCTLDKGYR